jgi:hypothetical protein
MTRLRELEAKQDELTERLSRAPVDMADVHPNIAGIYRRKVERLAEALRRPPERDEAAEAIRSLIERITSRSPPAPGAARPPRHCTATSADPRVDGPKSEHSRPEWRGSVGLGGCGGLQPPISKTSGSGCGDQQPPMSSSGWSL